MSFGEDRSRVRKDHADANMAALRRLALGLLKNESSKKVGIKNKRLVAAWNIDYLRQVLFGARLRCNRPATGDRPVNPPPISPRIENRIGPPRIVAVAPAIAFMAVVPIELEPSVRPAQPAPGHASPPLQLAPPGPGVAGHGQSG